MAELPLRPPFRGIDSGTAEWTRLDQAVFHLQCARATLEALDQETHLALLQDRLDIAATVVLAAVGNLEVSGEDLMLLADNLVAIHEELKKAVGRESPKHEWLWGTITGCLQCSETIEEALLARLGEPGPDDVIQ